MNQEELRCYLKKEEEQTFNDLCEDFKVSECRQGEHLNAYIHEVFSLKKNEKLRMSEKNEVF